MVIVSDGLRMRRHVGLNAHLLSLTQNYRGAGINGHIYYLLQHLPAVGDDFCFSAYLHDPSFRPSAQVSTMEVCRSRWDTRSPWRRIIWEQTRLAAISRRLDLLHGLAFAAPLAAACPTVVTVHDLSFLRFPSAFRPFNRQYLSLVTRVSVRRAARVIAVSESTRQDVINLCGVPAGRGGGDSQWSEPGIPPGRGCRGRCVSQAQRIARAFPAVFGHTRTTQECCALDRRICALVTLVRGGETGGHAGLAW